MSKHMIRFFVINFFIVTCLVPSQKIKEKDLPEKYRDFMKLVHYIILPQEKDVFLQLTSDRDRNIFIESFWKQRDPTLGTPPKRVQRRTYQTV